MKEEINFDWSKWGFLSAILIFLIGILMWSYQTYIYERKPNLSFEIISNEEVLTIKEDIDSLNINYKGFDLKRNNKNLSLLTFRVINNGNSGILKSYYDDEFPVGFIITNGSLLSILILMT